MIESIQLLQKNGLAFHVRNNQDPFHLNAETWSVWVTDVTGSIVGYCEITEPMVDLEHDFDEILDHGDRIGRSAYLAADIVAHVTFKRFDVCGCPSEVMLVNDDDVPRLNAIRDKIHSDAGGWCHLDYIYIDEHHRGKGVGSALLDLTCALFAQGCIVTLLPDMADKTLPAYYANRGFKKLEMNYMYRIEGKAFNKRHLVVDNLGAEDEPIYYDDDRHMFLAKVKRFRQDQQIERRKQVAESDTEHEKERRGVWGEV